MAVWMRVLEEEEIVTRVPDSIDASATAYPRPRHLQLEDKDDAEVGLTGGASNNEYMLSSKPGYVVSYSFWTSNQA